VLSDRRRAGLIAVCYAAAALSFIGGLQLLLWGRWYGVLAVIAGLGFLVRAHSPAVMQWIRWSYLSSAALGTTGVVAILFGGMAGAVLAFDIADRYLYAGFTMIVVGILLALGTRLGRNRTWAVILVSSVTVAVAGAITVAAVIGPRSILWGEDSKRLLAHLAADSAAQQKPNDAQRIASDRSASSGVALVSTTYSCRCSREAFERYYRAALPALGWSRRPTALQGGQGIRFSRQADGSARYLDIVREGRNFRVTVWADYHSGLLGD
jgi:hypothetical protein